MQDGSPQDQSAVELPARHIDLFFVSLTTTSPREYDAT
jgi:hypothetical protein